MNRKIDFQKNTKGMKKLSIKISPNSDKSSIYTEQKRYTILLGNGLTRCYSTNKDFTFAVSEINRQLNNMVFELNEIFIFCFTEYRRLWFHLPHIKYLSHEQEILDKNMEILRLFEKLSVTTYQKNGNVFAFRTLFDLMDCLMSELVIFSGIGKNKKQCIETKVIDVKIKTIERLYFELKHMDVKSKYSPCKWKSYTRKNFFNQLPEPASNN